MHFLASKYCSVHFCAPPSSYGARYSLAECGARVVIRLCTDDPEAVKFYTSIDEAAIEVDLDVIDDYFAEAVEVSRVGNGWLTYARPQHDYNQRKLGKPELLRFEALLTLDIR